MSRAASFGFPIRPNVEFTRIAALRSSGIPPASVPPLFTAFTVIPTGTHAESMTGRRDRPAMRNHVLRL